MKMRIIFTALLGLLFVLSINAFANEQISKRDIVIIQVYNNFVIIKLSEAIQNLDGCGATDRVGISLESDAGKEMFATVLSARIAGKQVGFGVSGCLPWGENTVAQVYRVDF